MMKFIRLLQSMTFVRLLEAVDGSPTFDGSDHLSGLSRLNILDEEDGALSQRQHKRVDSPFEPHLAAIMPKKVLRSQGNVDITSPSTFTLNNDNATRSEIVLDYARAEGGTPVFEIRSAGGVGEIQFQVIYSETLQEIDHATGDGPFFLFSNAMDSYRSINYTVKASHHPQSIRARHAQRSQRYQKLTLLTPNASLSFSSLGVTRIRPERPAKARFSCSDALLNEIWTQGVRTVDLCTVDAGETEPAWDVSEEGTVVYGQHWAPCRHGTRWKDYTATFEVRVERGGASWGVWMVANGLIFSVDRDRRVLTADEGQGLEASVFPSTPRGEWSLGPEIHLDGWLSVEVAALDDTVTISLDGLEVAVVHDLTLSPLLGGSSGNNTGAIAFGGPPGWISTYRNLSVLSPAGDELYSNRLLRADAARTFADFAVGTNALSSTVDGAKRDRATFGGDLHVMGRSIAYSTLAFDAIRGSVDLLTSHQTAEGYLGNLCPIQAPAHNGETEGEPPTYAFYSLTYALLLGVAVRDYWMHSGDEGIVGEVWPKLAALGRWVEGYVNERGLVEAPPALSLTFVPLVGPVFGVSTQVNLAYYDMLLGMATMSHDANETQVLKARAERLKESIVAHLWDEESGVLKLGENETAKGIAQDVNAYGISLGVSPKHEHDLANLRQADHPLPPTFTNLGPRFDEVGLCSPYATGFALEALLSRGEGAAALDLLRGVWGVMADESNPNFSGCHWEAMTLDGEPYHNTTSLVHGWSTSPVYLLPQYLAGLRPVEPGWMTWEARPVYAGLSRVEASIPTPLGDIDIRWDFDEGAGRGNVSYTVPAGTRGTIYPPDVWSFVDDAGNPMQNPSYIESGGGQVNATLHKI